MSAQESKPTTGALRKVGAAVVIVAALTVLGWYILHAPLIQSKMSTQGRAVAEVSRLALALDSYERDFGAYPPDIMPEGACSAEHQMSEVLTQYLTTTIALDQRKYGPYYEGFSEACLTDADSDGFPEFRDPWGGPFLYARKNLRGKALTVNDRFYDIVSAGPDGQLGGTMVSGTGYVPANTPEGKASEQDNITLDTKAIPGREFD